MAVRPRRNGRKGLAVDYASDPAFDPSENVKALNEAANKRQDDLRDASAKLVEARLESLEEVIGLHMQHITEMRDAESRRVDEQAALRASFAKELSDAEAKRIDAIRVVDVNAVSVAAQRSADQATILATQVQQSAETLRSLVATTASTSALAQRQVDDTLSGRITTLEQAQYKGEGRGTGVDKTWGIIAAVAAIAVAGIAAFSAIYVGRSSSVTPPQIIYVPTPPPVAGAPSAPHAP